MDYTDSLTMNQRINDTESAPQATPRDGGREGCE